jgi:hypothetical protein
MAMRKLVIVQPRPLKLTGLVLRWAARHLRQLARWLERRA